MGRAPRKTTLLSEHQAVYDACVEGLPLIDIIRRANHLSKERGLSEQSPGEVQRILGALRLMDMVAETDNGTWFAPVTPNEWKLLKELNGKRERQANNAAG